MADLTDLVGLDPDFTGGLDATEYVARQNCDHDETRAKTVEQFTAALLTGLDDLPRHNGDGTCIGAGDVADLVHKVALEVGRT